MEEPDTRATHPRPHPTEKINFPKQSAARDSSVDLGSVAALDMVEFPTACSTSCSSQAASAVDLLDHALRLGLDGSVPPSSIHLRTAMMRMLSLVSSSFEKMLVRFLSTMPSLMCMALAMRRLL